MQIKSPACRYIPPNYQKNVCLWRGRALGTRVEDLKIIIQADTEKDTSLYKKDTSYSEKDQVK